MLNLIFLFVLGSVFGSFFYVVGTRIPNKESLIKPGSHCTFCNHALGFFDLIPILSFLFLRGKCRYCHQTLSKEYLVYEVATGVLFVISYLFFSYSYEFFVMIIISSLLILIFITDFKYMLILDSPLLVSFFLLIFLQFFYYDFSYVFSHILSGFFSFITLYSIGKLGNLLFKKESLGGGDIKFSFIMGMILGFSYSMIALVLSTFLAFPYALGTLFFNKNSELPFGPFLVGSLFIVFLFLDKFQLLFTLFY